MTQFGENTVILYEWSQSEITAGAVKYSLKFRSNWRLRSLRTGKQPALEGLVLLGQWYMKIE